MTSNIIVHGGWLNDSFFIWGEQAPRSQFDQIVNFQYPFLTTPFELKLRLFRHDQSSFYGTFIQSDKAIIEVPIKSRQFTSFAGNMTVYQAEEKMERYSFPLEGIVLTADSLLTYLPIFRTWQQDDGLKLAPDFEMWLLVFEQIYKAITQGAFAPTAQGRWELTSFPYDKLFNAMPLSARAIRADSTLIHNETNTFINADQLRVIITMITDESIRSLIKESHVQQAYSDWKQAVDPKWLPQIQQLNEEGQLQTTLSNKLFQQEVGILQTKPFLSALALNEPSSFEGAWKLSLCMVDHKNPSIMVEMNQLERGEHPWRENPIIQLKHDLQLAKEFLPMLKPLTLASATFEISSEEAFDLFTNNDEALKKIGFYLVVPKWMSEKKKTRIKLQVEQPIRSEAISEPLLDWQSIGSFTYEVAIGNQTISEQEFAEFVDGQRPFLYVNNEWIAWDRSLAEQLRKHLEDINEQKSYLDMWRLDQLDDESNEEDYFDWDISWTAQLTESLQQLYSTSPSLIPLPAQFTGELRPYQHVGVSWLAHLRRVGFGGCLADDMGLGKSIQTIVYMQYVLEQQEKAGTKHHPFLLICPTSLLYNWTQECKQFGPSLRVFIHHGKTRLDEQDLDLSEWDVVITTYQLTVRDAQLFHSITWNGLILDEAQHIKNIETKQRRIIKGIVATHRIALTGTPIENRLQELWSLLDVLNPSYLGSYRDFQSQFITPIERERDNNKLEKLQQLIQPLILRRKKSDQSLDLCLPEKKEVVHHVHLSVEQAALYQAVVDEVITKLNDVSSLERRALILKSLTKLKQICNHPAHFLKENTLDNHDSGKWQALLSSLDKMINNDEKVLIFSQYKEMGSLISKSLEQRYKQSVPFLHGSLTRTKRQEAIQSFQTDDTIQIFVLSLKAGGVGLNLTAATNVVHYDRWWNPAVENQATDRAYRIGQLHDVTVHKMISVGTLEERIDKMLIEKQALAEEVLSVSQQSVTELTNDEMIALIQLTN